MMHFWVSQLEAEAKARRAAEQARRDENARAEAEAVRVRLTPLGRPADPTPGYNSARRDARGLIAVIASSFAPRPIARQLSSGRAWHRPASAWI